MKVLFVCSANLNRSPRAAEVFRRLANQRGLDVEVLSAGTDAWAINEEPSVLREKYGVESCTQLTKEMLKEADIVFPLDDRTRESIREEFQVLPKRTIPLNIPDRFSFRDGNLDKLYEILNQKLEPIVEKIFPREGGHPGKEVT